MRKEFNRSGVVKPWGRGVEGGRGGEWPGAHVGVAADAVLAEGVGVLAEEAQQAQRRLLLHLHGCAVCFVCLRARARDGEAGGGGNRHSAAFFFNFTVVRLVCVRARACAWDGGAGEGGRAGTAPPSSSPVRVGAR